MVGNFGVLMDSVSNDPEIYHDALGTPIELGNIVAYPIKRGSSSCRLRIGRVTRADKKKGNPQVEIKTKDWPWDWNQRPACWKLKRVPLQNPDRVVVVRPKAYAAAMKFVLPEQP